MSRQLEPVQMQPHQRDNEVVTPTGVVVLKPAYYAVVQSERQGELHIGLYGVTVIYPSGASTLFPWGRVLAVKVDAP